MTDFLASEERALLERNGLGTFDQLWARQLDAVDEPNTGRGGHSSVYRLDVEGRGFYLKRQTNYLTHTLRHPLASRASRVSFAISAVISSWEFQPCRRCFSGCARSMASPGRSS